MNDLVVTTKGGSVLYARMQTAISRCHSVDDCISIGDQAAAIAAYYKQINDEESIVKYSGIKLRAWRRIGEICAAVDTSGCQSQEDRYEKIQHRFPKLRPDHVRQAVQLAEIPAEFFDQKVEEARKGINGNVLPWNVGQMLREYAYWQYEQSPIGQAQKAKRDAERTAHAAKIAEKKAGALPLTVSETMDETQASYNEAYAEVGYTMDRRDRKTMRAIVLLIKDSLHSTLRRAAFDNHLTMQAVLRAGLTMWLTEHGYDPEPERKSKPDDGHYVADH